ncbi:MAG: ATP-binding cassette domain-containing protein [Ectothiorhodospiraceae bacterium]|nr:ATP-binding cassette domain-containing protein [Ectothiorhodospiraceae bacterium]
MSAAGAPLEIRIEHLSKAFGDHVVLQDVSLDVRLGDVLAIVGGSGCGKTVLLKHVLGELEPDSGRVLVADHDAAGAPLRDLAALGPLEMDRVHTHWGVVFQRNALFSGTVLDNIALWMREISGADEATIAATAHEVLTAVGLPCDEDFLATGHEELSGGMAKRLAVARALSMRPVVLFFDEPTTGLDPTSAAQVHELIHATHVAGAPDGGPRTTVIITHDKDLLRRLRPRVAMLHDGGVFFDGPFEAFESSTSAIVRPYFDQMPILHRRQTG